MDFHAGKGAKKMPYHYWWGNGMWFFPLFFLAAIALCIVMFFLFGRRCFGPWRNQGRDVNGGTGGETALDILKKRYAKGEISREEFEQMKKDIT